MSADDPIQTEAAIRAAALAAARGVPLGEAYLSKIVAETNQPGLSVADRIARASTMAEQFASSPKPLNVLSATPQEMAVAAASAQFAVGRNAVPLSIERDSGRRFADIKETSTSDASGLARELGIRGSDASLLVGASSHMRDAIRAFVKDGTAISDDDVRNVGDVKAVMALVRSGKIKEDDPRVPPSVRAIIQDMKKDGIDPATAKTEDINDWLKKHPKALEAAKKQNKIDDKAVAKIAPDNKTDKVQEKQKTVSPSQTAPAAKAAPKSGL